MSILEPYLLLPFVTTLIFFGIVFIDIFLFSYIAIRICFASPSRFFNLIHLVGSAFWGGISFTMALFNLLYYIN